MKNGLDCFNFRTNVVLITLDSCRWDTFCLARAPNIKARCEFKKAYSQATYTYPAHMSLYSGILPNSEEFEPYYNRFCLNLFRMSGRAKIPAYIQFPEGTEDIIRGFERRGYKTIGCAAMDWFKHPNLNKPFQHFGLIRTNFKKQIEYVKNQVRTAKVPSFIFVNIGETHEPYEYGGVVEVNLISRARMRARSDVGYLVSEHNKQIAALEYIDSLIPELFECLSSDCGKTLIIVCGDHGECFGEDGCYGHGFYHPKVMEVPLGIFSI